jgi:hypothetical protein
LNKSCVVFRVFMIVALLNESTAYVVIAFVAGLWHVYRRFCHLSRYGMFHTVSLMERDQTESQTNCV